MSKYSSMFIESIYYDSDRERALKGELKSRDCISFHCTECGSPTSPRSIHNTYKISSGEWKLPRGPLCSKCYLSPNSIGNQGKNRTFPEGVLDDVSPNQDLSAPRGGGSPRWKWICPLHGEYEQLYSNHRMGCIGCPECFAGRHTGKVEDSIVEYLRQTYEVKQSVRSLIKGPRGHWMEIDIYLPDINFAIEVDGRYYHQEIYETWEEYRDPSNMNENGYPIGKWKGYSQWKTDRCADIGIKLIHVVPEDGFDICVKQIEEAINELQFE